MIHITKEMTDLYVSPKISRPQYSPTGIRAGSLGGLLCLLLYSYANHGVMIYRFYNFI